jgi:hypothetical protein
MPRSVQAGFFSEAERATPIAELEVPKVETE